MRFLRWAALLVSCGLLVAGCSDAESGTPATTTAGKRANAAPRKQDVAWVVLLAKWENRLARRTERATDVARDVRAGTREQAELDRAVRPLEGCAQNLDAEVGRPLVPRYRHSYELFGTACDSVADWAGTLADDAGSKDSSLDEIAAKERVAGDRLGDAARALEASFLAVQPLPIKGGRTSSSRIEPRFGRALNKLLYKNANAAQVEVRCWSKKEWPRVKYEWGGYAGTVDFAGFAYNEFQVSIASEYCASLVDLVYEHQRPKSGYALSLAAASVALLAHEGGHLFESETNEARTECYAVQRMAELGRILGLGAEYSDGLARVYWKYLYPRNPPAYKTRLCRNDGPLDLDPKSDEWAGG